MTHIFIDENPQWEGEKQGGSNIPTTLSLQVKGCLNNILYLVPSKNASYEEYI